MEKLFSTQFNHHSQLKLVKWNLNRLLVIFLTLSMRLNIVFFLIFFILSDFNQLNCIFIIDFIESSSTRTFMGEQKAKASEPLSHAQFSAEHKTSLQLA